MMQVNLLPDLKIEFLKAQRTKRIVVTVATLLSIIMVALVVLFSSYVFVAQRQHTNNLQTDIDSLSRQFQGIDDIQKVATVQKQLAVLSDLHGEKNASSRLPSFLTKLTPGEVSLNEVQLNFEDNELLISGAGKSVKSVNTFADTLKNAVYSLNSDPAGSMPAFVDVTLSRISTDDEGGASFEIRAEFDADLFSSAEGVNLQVPKITSSSGAATNQSSLFEESSIDEEGAE